MARVRTMMTILSTVCVASTRMCGAKVVVF